MGCMIVRGFCPHIWSIFFLENATQWKWEKGWRSYVQTSNVLGLYYTCVLVSCLAKRSLLLLLLPGSGLGDLHFFGVAMLLLFLHKLHMVLTVGQLTRIFEIKYLLTKLIKYTMGLVYSLKTSFHKRAWSRCKATRRSFPFRKRQMPISRHFF